MNLKMKLNKHLTAVVQILSNTECIFSDECSPTHKNALCIITAKSAKKLRAKIDKHAIALAAETNFPCIVMYIKNDVYEVKQLTKSKASKEYSVW